MTEAEYAQKPGIRFSHLRWMARSAMHYISAVEGLLGGDTRKLRLGRALHSFLLEPDVFKATWVAWGARRQGKKWEEFKAAAGRDGKEIVTWAEMAMVTNAAAAIQRHPDASSHLGGAREVFVTWLDQDTGLRCKARIDLLTADRLLDVKSTTNVHEWVFGSLAARLGYHAKLAFYADGLAASGIVVEPEPVIIAVEIARPWDVVPFELPLPVVEQGRRDYKALLLKVAECQARGEWPGRCPKGMVQLEIPERYYSGGFDDGLDAVEPGSVFE